MESKMLVWVVGGVGWWVVLGSGGGGKFMLVLVFGGYREQNLSALLLLSRSAFLLRSRSALLLRCRSALLLRCRSALLLYRRFVLGIWVVTFVLVILGVVVFSSGAGYDGGGGGLCM